MRDCKILVFHALLAEAEGSLSKFSCFSRTRAANAETSHRFTTVLIKSAAGSDSMPNGQGVPNFDAHSADHSRIALAGIKIAPLTQPACHSVQSYSEGLVMAFAIAISKPAQVPSFCSSSRRPRTRAVRATRRGQIRGRRLFGRDDRCAFCKCSRQS